MQILRSWCQSVLNKRILVWKKKPNNNNKIWAGKSGFPTCTFEHLPLTPRLLHWVSPKGRHELGGKLLRLFTSSRSLGECWESHAKVTKINILTRLRRLDRLTPRKGPPSAPRGLRVLWKAEALVQGMVSRTWASPFSGWNFPLASLSYCINDTFLNYIFVKQVIV